MKSTLKTTMKKTLKRSPFDVTIVVSTFAVMLYAFFPILSVNAIEQIDTAIAETQWETTMAVMNIQNEAKPFGELPESGKAEPRYFSTITISAYNSVPWQTDATPCIGAQGTDICEYYERGEDVCAANFVPLGTILEVEGLGECTVRDRMNARYYYRVDWYMGMDVAAARSFGIQQKAVSIYPSNK